MERFGNDEELEMPTLPWTAGPTVTTEPGESIVMASRFHVRRHRDVLPFFLDAMRVFALVRRSPGAVGVTLEAHPLRKEFWTLSQWRDQESLDAMVRSDLHASVMVRGRKVMADSAFRFWSVPAAEPPTWQDARRRLADE